MKKSKADVTLTSEQKLHKLANELYYRTKGKAFVNGSQAMFGEYDEQGNRRTLAQVLKVSKSYGITTFIELGLMETEGSKKYTSSTNVRWIGEAPTKEISDTLKQWCKDYNKKMAEELAFRTALKQEEAELKAKAEQVVEEVVVETPVVEVPVVDEKPTVATKAELNEMLGEEKAPVEKSIAIADPLPENFGRLTALQQYNLIQLQRNEIEERRNVIEERKTRIFASILTELKTLNKDKIILGTEYSARG